MPAAAEPGREPARAGEPQVRYQASLVTVLREWGRIGCVGFGGPPSHIALLRKLCVDREHWLGATEFEDAISACNLLPGPASTQLAIFCAWRVRGRLGALAGGGAGAAVAAVAVQAGWSLLVPSWTRAKPAGSPRRIRWVLYLLAGGGAAAAIGPWLVLVLLGCGLTELAVRHPRRAGPRGASGTRSAPRITTLPLVMVPGAAVRAAGTAVAAGGLAALAWTAFKVGALSFGGGFVIIPLMRADAVGHHWMTSAQFLNAVALGQITPGPVVQTVAAVGYAAGGVGGGLLAALIAFSPSFVFVLGGARYFTSLRGNKGAQAFLDGAGPAAIGAILGSAIPLTTALTQPWQYAVLAGALLLLLGLRRGVVFTLLTAGVAGLIISLAGGPLPH